MTATSWPIFIGWSGHDMEAYAVAVASLRRYSTTHPIKPIARQLLALKHLYWRPTLRLPSGQLFDEISDAPMSTDHAIARFFVPYLCRYEGWALFTDGDVLFRTTVDDLFALADARYAVQVVQHPPQQARAHKMRGEIQQAYPCKNWSSAMLWHCGHPANRALTPDLLNSWPGRDLHAFKWLDADRTLVGALPLTWNWLVGESDPIDSPAMVHYTLGTPNLPDHRHDPFADEWFACAEHIFEMGEVTLP